MFCVWAKPQLVGELLVIYTWNGQVYALPPTVSRDYDFFIYY